MPIPIQDPGPFLSALGWASDIGQVPLQFLRGRPGAASRKLVDVLGDIPDALLPGDWIPHIGSGDPNVRPSELVGIDVNAHPGIAKAADIVGGAALNPLSYVGLRGGTAKFGLPLTEGTAIPGATEAIARGRGWLDRGVDMLPEDARRMAGKTAAAVRRTANWMDVPDEYASMIDQAKGAGSQQADIAAERVKQIYQTASPEVRAAVGDVVHRVNRTAGADRSQWSVIDDNQAYLDALPPVIKDQAATILDARANLMDSLAQDPTHGLTGAARNAAESGDGYGMRRFSGSYFDDTPPPDFLPKGASQPSPLRAQQDAIKTPSQLLDFLQNEPGANLDFDPLSFDMHRAAKSGRIAEKAKLGERLIPQRVEKLQSDLAAATDPDVKAGIESELNSISSSVGQSPGGGFRLNNPDHVQAVRSAISDLAASKEPGASDAAYRLKNMFDGVAPRGEDAFSQALLTGNKLFKSAATFGVALPRLSFNVGNRASGLWQVLSNEQARGTIGPATGRALSDLWGSVDDGLMRLFPSKGRWSKGELTQSLDAIDQAKTAAQGDTRKFRELLGQAPMLQEALDSGVLTGFVDSEQLISRMAKTPRAQRVADFMEWPADVAQGVEQRMRLGTFMDLRKRGVDTPSAAKTVQDTYLDYDKPGVANRRFRDAVPFGAFMSQNIKQQAGFVARHPVVLSAAAPLFSDDEGTPKYPWMDKQANVPVGLDEKGNAQFISGFRSPLEGLSTVPGSDPSDIWSDTVGNFQPLLKTALSYAANRDPFTGKDFGNYDKILGHSAGTAGRAYNIAKGSGLFQPLTSPLDQLTNALDDRKSVGERVLQGTTGVKFTSVDADQAKRQRIEAYLNASPEAQQYTSYYNSGDNPELTGLLQQLNDAKARIKEKKKAAASAL